MVFSFNPELVGPIMTFKIKKTHEKHGSRHCLPGDLRCANIVDLQNEINQVGQPAILDLDEVHVIDLDGIRFPNDCLARGIQVVNCTPYIREWMLLERLA